MFRFDLLNCSLKRKPVGVLYKANDKPPAKLDAAINAMDLLAGRSLSMMTLDLVRLFSRLEDGGVPVDNKRRVGVVFRMRECMRWDARVLRLEEREGDRRERSHDAR